MANENYELRENNEENVKMLIAQNPGISQTGLTEELDISRPTIWKRLKRLKEKKGEIIERRDPENESRKLYYLKKAEIKKIKMQGKITAQLINNFNFRSLDRMELIEKLWRKSDYMKLKELGDKIIDDEKLEEVEEDLKENWNRIGSWGRGYLEVIALWRLMLDWSFAPKGFEEIKKEIDSWSPEEKEEHKQDPKKRKELFEDKESEDLRKLLKLYYAVGEDCQIVSLGPFLKPKALTVWEFTLSYLLDKLKSSDSLREREIIDEAVKNYENVGDGHGLLPYRAEEISEEKKDRIEEEIDRLLELGPLERYNEYTNVLTVPLEDDI